MSEQEIETAVDPTDVETETDADVVPTIDDYNRTKESLSKATSNYVLPWKEMLKKYGVSSFEELDKKLSQEKDNFITKEAHELDKFLSKNPDLSDKSDELLETAKALKALAKNKDKSLLEVLDIASKTLKVEEETNQNNERLKKSRVTDGDGVSTASSYTKEELEKLALSNSKAYDKAMERIESGEAKYKG